MSAGSRDANDPRDLRTALLERIRALEGPARGILEADLESGGMADSRDLAGRLGLGEEEVCEARTLARRSIQEGLGSDLADLGWYAVLDLAGFDVELRPLGEAELAAEARADPGAGVEPASLDLLVETFRSDVLESGPSTDSPMEPVAFPDRAGPTADTPPPGTLPFFLRAAAAVLVIGVGIYLVVLRPQEPAPGLQVATVDRILVAHGGGLPPRDEDLQRLSGYFEVALGEPTTLPDPFDERSWDELEGLASRVLLRGGGTQRRPRLLAPLATVADPRPVFRFEPPSVDALGADRVHYALNLVPDGGEREELPFDRPSPAGGVETTTLPAGRELEPGGYEWFVGLDRAWHGELAEIYAPYPRSFEVVDPEVRDRILALEITGDRTTDGLLRAHLLNERGLHSEALRVMSELPRETTSELEALRRYLLGQAHAGLGDPEAFDAILGELEASVRDR